MPSGKCGWNISKRRSGVVSKSAMPLKKSSGLHSKRCLRVVKQLLTHFSSLGSFLFLDEIPAWPFFGTQQCCNQCLFYTRPILWESSSACTVTLSSQRHTHPHDPLHTDTHTEKNRYTTYGYILQLHQRPEKAFSCLWWSRKAKCWTSYIDFEKNSFL